MLNKQSTRMELANGDTNLCIINKFISDIGTARIEDWLDRIEIEEE